MVQADLPQTPRATPRRPAFDEDTIERERRRSTLRFGRASLASVAQDTIDRAHTPRRVVSGGPEDTPTRGGEPIVRGSDIQRVPSRQVSGSSRRQSGQLRASAADFEEWMKVVRGKGVTAANAWSLGIIDYFHDLVKEGNAVNFQKASLTLDGCVKVYTSRVDSAVAQTSKLLSGLISSQPADAEDSEEAGAVDDDGKVRKKRRAKPRTTTCMKPETQELDIEQLRRMAGVGNVAVSDFDEGGTKGTRLWTEQTDCLGWVGGTRKETDRRAEAAAESDGVHKSAGETEMIVEGATYDGAFVDMAYQRPRFFDSMEGRRVHPSAGAVDSAVADPQDGTNALVQNMHDWNINGQDDGVEGFDGFDGGDAGGDLDYDRLEEAFSEVGADMSLNHGADESFALANASDGPRGVVNWDVMAYFDENKGQSWAGRDHWRLRQYQHLKDSSRQIDRQRGSGTAGAPATRKKRFAIDFAEEGPSAEDVFKLPTNLKQLNKPDKRTAKYAHILPVDLAYRSRRQLALFLPPGNRVGPAFRRVRHARPVTANTIDGDNESGNETEGDQLDFWSQANEGAPQENEADFYGGENEQDFGPGDNTQDFGGNEDGLDAAADFNDANGSAPEADLLDQLPQSRNRGIGFARAARNVDVHQLKNNMWHIMTEEASAQTADEPLSLAKVMEDTAAGYRPEKRSELSTPFYFICLLHLANEQGLELHNTALLDDLEILNTPHTS